MSVFKKLALAKENKWPPVHTSYNAEDLGSKSQKSGRPQSHPEEASAAHAYRAVNHWEPCPGADS